MVKKRTLFNINTMITILIGIIVSIILANIVGGQNPFDDLFDSTRTTCIVNIKNLPLLDSFISDASCKAVRTPFCINIGFQPLGFFSDEGKIIGTASTGNKESANWKVPEGFQSRGFKVTFCDADPPTFVDFELKDKNKAILDVKRAEVD